VALSLVLIRRLPAPQRRAWLLVLLAGSVLVVTFPVGQRVPRYILFAPVLASLAISVVAGVARGTIERRAITLLGAAILFFTSAYAYTNIVASGAWREAYSHLRPYHPVGRLGRYAYVQRGHLRIGYTSGFGNFIAALYDWRLTNTLIPLHYRNYPFNYWKEFDNPAQFLASVRSLDLDYIHIFDEHYPGVEILRRQFPDKVDAE
jgi:hypothetical protein